MPLPFLPPFFRGRWVHLSLSVPNVGFLFLVLMSALLPSYPSRYSAPQLPATTQTLLGEVAFLTLLVAFKCVLVAFVSDDYIDVVHSSVIFFFHVQPRVIRSPPSLIVFIIVLPFDYIDEPFFSSFSYSTVLTAEISAISKSCRLSVCNPLYSGTLHTGLLFEPCQNTRTLLSVSCKQDTARYP